MLLRKGGSWGNAGMIPLAAAGHVGVETKAIDVFIRTCEYLYPLALAWCMV
jgi:hypothetical protein